MLYPGNVSWTEQGSRFCWHMMLRDKQVQVLRFQVTNPQTGDSYRVDPAHYLNIDQHLTLAWYPDAMLQFAHFIADEYQEKHGVRPTVHVNAIESLNFRPLQPMIDSSVDLASVKNDWSAKQWVVPLRPLSPAIAEHKFRAGLAL
jgi:hypothetical protein